MFSTRLCCRPAAGLLTLLLAVPVANAQPSQSAPATPTEAAARIDAFFQRQKDLPQQPPVDDVAFLRRVYLDLTGKLPSPEAVRQFAAETAADKRGKVIDQLLDSEAYAVNWGRYWRDVVSYHTPASGN